MREKKCVFFHWSEDKPHEGDCVYYEPDYQARDIKEVKYGEEQMAKGFAKGYHLGLSEGYRKAGYHEICHCHCCRSHGELC